MDLFSRRALLLVAFASSFTYFLTLLYLSGLVSYVSGNKLWAMGIVTLSLLLLLFDAFTRPTPAPPRDVWDYQREMMKVSGQRLPTRPEINGGLLLYYALTLEELAETSDVIHRVLLKHQLGWGHAAMLSDLKTTTKGLQAGSRALRNYVARSHSFAYPLSRADAAELLDGVTDVMVTTAGMPLAAGLPASAGYVAVQSSNLSKVNPETGVIDKTPDGKWVKGSAYKPPDLISVLEQTAPR